MQCPRRACEPAEEPGHLAAADEQWLAEVARRLHRARLAPVALLWLEASLPLSWLGGQLLHVLHPLVTALVPEAPLGRLATLLEDRDHLDRLVELIASDPSLADSSLADPALTDPPAEAAGGAGGGA